MYIASIALYTTTCLHTDYINVVLLKIIVCVSSKNGQSLTKMACDNTQKSSMLLVRKLYMLMQNLGPLPDNICLNMKLFYYDEGKSTSLSATDSTMYMKLPMYIVCHLFLFSM